MEETQTVSLVCAESLLFLCNEGRLIIHVNVNAEPIHHYQTMIWRHRLKYTLTNRPSHIRVWVLFGHASSLATDCLWHIQRVFSSRYLSRGAGTWKSLVSVKMYSEIWPSSACTPLFPSRCPGASTSGQIFINNRRPAKHRLGNHSGPRKENGLRGRRGWKTVTGEWCRVTGW